MPFPININQETVLPSDELVLYNASKSPIGSLNSAYNTILSSALTGDRHLTCDVPMYIVDASGNRINNSIYNNIQESRLIRLSEEDSSFFRITSVKELRDEDDNVYRTIQAVNQESFLVDVNPNMVWPSYELILYRMSEEPLGSLKSAYEIIFSPVFVGVHNLSFNVPMYIMDTNGDNLLNPIYDNVKGDYLIKLLGRDEAFFIITNVKEVVDDNGDVYKQVECKSREYSLIDKKIVDYEGVSRQLYDPSNGMMDDLEIGILNYIFKHVLHGWTLERVDPDLYPKPGSARELKFPNSNLIQVFTDLQKTFNCIFRYDTVNKTIRVYKTEALMGTNKGLYISDKNFIKNILKNVNTDGIVTRLYLYGQDNVSVQYLSPTGQPYIDRFDWYETTEYMTEGLIASLAAYKAKIATYSPNFPIYYNELVAANGVKEELINKEDSDYMKKGLAALEISLSEINTQIEIKQDRISVLRNALTEEDNGDRLEDITALEREVSSLMYGKYDSDGIFLAPGRKQISERISAVEQNIENAEVDIEAVINKIQLLQKELSTSNADNFNRDELAELDYFIKEDTFSNSAYTEDTIKELLLEGQRQLDMLSQPKIQFDIDVVDFLSLVEYQHVWKKFVLGDGLTLIHQDINTDVKVRLVGYEHNVDSNTLNLKFSNTNSYDDASMYERELLENIDDLNKTVAFSIDKWNDAANMESRITRMIDAELEKARQNVLTAVGQRYQFGDDGFWLYKEDQNGFIHPEQIRAVNNTIALTRDNWSTVSTALTPDGVVAENIYGKLGKFATIKANQIHVGGNSDWDYDGETDNHPRHYDYKAGDIWRKGGIFWLCIESRDGFDNPFKEEHWVEALGSKVDNVQEVIQNSMDDNFITQGEALSILSAYNTLVSESLYLTQAAKKILVELNIDSSKVDNGVARKVLLQNSLNNYETALANFKAFLDEHWLDHRDWPKDYPVPVTNTQRNMLAIRIADVTNTKDILNKEVLSHTALMPGEVYNGVRMDRDVGLQVSRSDGKFQSTFNATDGITMVKNPGNAVTKETVFSVDTVGNVHLKGTLTVGANSSGIDKFLDAGGLALLDSVAAGQIDNGAITSDKIKDGAVVTDKIGPQAIVTEKIKLGAIESTLIKDGAIITGKIAANAIVAEKIATNAITSDKITANAITSVKIDANAITSVKINADAITAEKIKANAITTEKINADAITAEKIKANAITAIKINTGAITADKIDAKAVTANKISVSSLSSINSNLGAITAGSININSGKFIVDSAGNVTMAGSINMSQGSISWSSNNSPVVVQYSVNGSSNWYTTYNSSHLFARYSYDGGRTYTAAVRIQGVNGAPGAPGRDGRDGRDGSDAYVPSYIKSTYIDFSQVSSPRISGNFVNGGVMTGGVIQTAATGKRIRLDGYDNSMTVHATNGATAFTVDYDTDGAGTTEESKNRVFLRTENYHALKIESKRANMSIGATGGGTVFFMSTVSFAGQNVIGLKMRFS